ncbi:hypothetical protein GSY69_11940 [Brevibacterium sp. 5221]|uniref:Uncharacterized protein n=1 Tax=Brevibacterium rongguiense TaxID=2695267 RepID=A0A6N9H977_9MICO|nr:hypothetical protein [Brevibacterium rongguiense]MYM20650.1 hypothetical protein [Brevibacterium rongguiense]
MVLAAQLFALVAERRWDPIALVLTVVALVGLACVTVGWRRLSRPSARPTERTE